jgi:nitroreductase
MTQIDPSAIDALIRSRRSTFPKQLVSGKKIPDETVLRILENATWAPTHGRTEPWFFVVYTGEGLRRLGNFQSELYKNEEPNFKEDKYIKLKEQPLLASHIIAICMKRTENTRIPEIEEVAAVACAVENIYLSLNAYGIGGYWTTGGPTYLENAKTFFGLGPADKLLGFFYLGYIALPSPAGTRKPLSEKMKWVTE